jgi:hypothetical protein
MKRLINRALSTFGIQVVRTSTIANFIEQQKQETYKAWCQRTFGAAVPKPGEWEPGVWVATSFPPDTEWGQKSHEALLGVEVAYVDRLLAELCRDAVPGVIAEFGIFEGSWINRLYEASERVGLLCPVVGFDSFRGLSAPHPTFDSLPVQQGQFSASIETVRKYVRAAERPRIRLIEGYFADSLERAEAQSIDRVAYARIDCDLYEPAAQCLRYLGPRLSHGAVLVFDEWQHRTDVGEGRAFAEWLPTVPNLRFEFLFFGTYGHFYIRVWHRDRDR